MESFQSMEIRGIRELQELQDFLESMESRIYRIHEYSANVIEFIGIKFWVGMHLLSPLLSNVGLRSGLLNTTLPGLLKSKFMVSPTQIETPADGNCMMLALFDQLQFSSHLKTFAKDQAALRRKIVDLGFDLFIATERLE